jgi:hypothetical protein
MKGLPAVLEEVEVVVVLVVVEEEEMEEEETYQGTWIRTQ